MSPEAHDSGPPPIGFDGDPLLASLVRDVNTRDTEEGLSITLTVGGYSSLGSWFPHGVRQSVHVAP